MVKILLASMFLLQAAAAGAAAESLPAADGIAIGDLWVASAAEYQASIEELLDRLGARNIQQADLTGPMVAGFLRMFSGGGGAPQDLVRPRTDALGSEDSE